MWLQSDYLIRCVSGLVFISYKEQVKIGFFKTTWKTIYVMKELKAGYRTCAVVSVMYRSFIWWKEVYSHYPLAFTQRAALSASPAPGQYDNAPFVSLATLMQSYSYITCVFPLPVPLLQLPTSMQMERRLTAEECWWTWNEDALSKDGTHEG